MPLATLLSGVALLVVESGFNGLALGLGQWLLLVGDWLGAVRVHRRLGAAVVLRC